jgi:translation initiation factor 2 subunit 1
LKIVEEACQAVEDRIKSIGGSFNYHMKPKVVTATDEADLAKQLERADMENREVIISD